MFDDWNRRWRFKSRVELEREIRERAAETLEYLDGLGLNEPRILEIGCGTGWLTQDLCERGSVWACDLSSTAIEFARKRSLNAEFCVGNVADLDHPRGEVAIIFDTLFSVEDQQGLIDRLSERVRWLILSNINAFVFSRCAEVGPPEPGQLRKWLSISETVRLLAPHFAVEKISTVFPHRGNQGLMRLIQSRWTNGPLSWLPLDRLKNGMRLGAGVQILARNNRQEAPFPR